MASYYQLCRNWNTQPHKKESQTHMDSVEMVINKEELHQAHAHVYNHMLHFISSMSLKCAIQLEIPDVIHNHGKPMTISELVEALPIHHTKAPCVNRLMRLLVQNGFLGRQKRLSKSNQDSKEEEEEEEGYVLTNASRLLLKDNPLKVLTPSLPMLEPILIEPWHYLNAWFRNEDPSPFESAHGRSFWDFCGEDPKLNISLNEAMACNSRYISHLLLDDSYKGVFEGIKCLVDVGGGTGTMAKDISKAFPHLGCIIFDLPHVVAGLEDNDKLKYVGGDMFQRVPEADAILLKCILHNWNDEECVKILKHCKEAIKGKERGKVIIIEMVLKSREGNTIDDGSIGTQLYMDMLMMTFFNGQERDEKEWAKLFYEAGYNKYTISPIFGLRSLIEIFP